MPAPLTTSRAVYLPAGRSAVQVLRIAPLRPTRPSRTRTARWPGLSRSTRTRAPRVARSANVTGAPGATVSGVAVKARAVGPATVPPLPDAWAGGASRARTSSATITPQLSAPGQPL